MVADGSVLDSRRSNARPAGSECEAWYKPPATAWGPRPRSSPLCCGREPPKLTPIKAIREKCLDCSGGSRQEVRLCPITRCALWPYRLGKRPASTMALQLARPEGSSVGVRPLYRSNRDPTSVVTTRALGQEIVRSLQASL
jgi:hypothetical protein